MNDDKTAIRQILEQQTPNEVDSEKFIKEVQDLLRSAEQALDDARKKIFTLTPAQYASLALRSSEDKIRRVLFELSNRISAIRAFLSKGTEK